MKQKAIATGAIFASLITALTLLSYAIPGIELLFVFFLPFFSSYISFEFGLKRAIPFLLTTIILSCLVSYIVGLIYVLPSIISGIIFGVISKKINNIIDIGFIMSFVEAVLFALSMFFIAKIFAINIFKDYGSILNLNYSIIKTNSLAILYIVGLSQSIFTSLIIMSNYQKLNIKNYKIEGSIFIFIVNILSIIGLLIFYQNKMLIKFIYLIYFVTLIIQTIFSFKVKIKYNWIFWVIQIITFLFICIPVLTIINDSLKLFVYSWVLVPLVVKNCIQLFKFCQ